MAGGEARRDMEREANMLDANRQAMPSISTEDPAAALRFCQALAQALGQPVAATAAAARRPVISVVAPVYL